MHSHIGGDHRAAEESGAMAQKEREFRELILRVQWAQPFAENAGGFFHGAQ